MTQRIVLLMIDRPADWEYGPLAGAAHAWFGIDVVSASLDAAPLTTMGGLSLQPQRRLDELSVDDAELWVVPGSPLWDEAPAPAPIVQALRERAARGRAIAGICGGTRALAAAGLLNERAHTSNEPGYLDAVPGYNGQAHYREQACVSADGIVTAPGTSPVSFAEACLRLVVPERAEGIAQMHGMFAREFV
ncbi:DJ-1/PfpI family protein [Lysobacter sp. K5869]|uniref:DJ-1/PfpI family protein n=1 Tax=Lysobacter sp. K5869 TaxID=2820808 RepID=UPI001C062871|nr:DJ-1/PfpI family protein [Lysobacter sp. K5869]QWP78812.1 DJ-1/PfpI family protein [Lysobacter sp. K5869]